MIFGPINISPIQKAISDIEAYKIDIQEIPDIKIDKDI